MLKLKYIDTKKTMIILGPNESIKNEDLTEDISYDNRVHHYKTEDEFIRDTPAHILEMLNVITNRYKQPLECSNPYEIFDMHYCQQFPDGLPHNLYNIIYEYCEIYNEKKYVEYIYNRYVREQLGRSKLFSKKDIFEYKDNINYYSMTNLDIAVSFYCNHIQKNDYKRYKMSN